MSATETKKRAMVWSEVPYEPLARILAPAAADLVRFADVSDGEEVVDVACGTGNAAITAHRNGATVTGVDLNDELIEQAREKAARIGADIDFVVDDALELPFDDNAFDTALSAFGHFLTPDPLGALEELKRVTRPGGRVAFASYDYDGIIGRNAEVIDAYSPDDEEVLPPFKWGDRDYLSEQIESQFDELTFDSGAVYVNAVSPEHAHDYWLDISVVSKRRHQQFGHIDGYQEDRIENIREFFDGNQVELGYLLVKGTI